MRCAPFVWLLLLTVLSCSKTEQAPFTLTALNTGTELDLTCVHFLNEDTGFIAGGSRYSEAIVLRTTDGGQNWLSIDVGLSVGIFDLDCLHGSLCIAAAYGGQLAKSTDLGQTWQSIDLGFPDNSYMPLRTVKIIDEQQIITAGGVGYELGVVAKSDNAGNTWTVTYNDTVEFRSIAKIDERIILAGFSEVHHSSNNGDSWQQFKADGDYFSDIAAAENQLYVCGIFGTILTSSTDNTEAWTMLRDGNKLLKKRWEMEAIATFDDPNLVYLAGKNLLKFSQDAGNNWLNLGDQDADFKDLFLLSNKSGYAVGNQGLLVKFTHD